VCHPTLLFLLDSSGHPIKIFSRREGLLFCVETYFLQSMVETRPPAVLVHFRPVSLSHTRAKTHNDKFTAGKGQSANFVLLAIMLHSILPHFSRKFNSTFFLL